MHVPQTPRGNPTQWRTLGGARGGASPPNNFSKNQFCLLLFNQIKTFSIKNDCINTLFFLTQPKTTTLKVYQITTASLQI